MALQLSEALLNLETFLGGLQVEVLDEPFTYLGSLQRLISDSSPDAVKGMHTENFVLNNIALLKRDASGLMFVDHVVSRNEDLISELSTTADASLAVYIGGNEVALTRKTLIPVVGLQYNEIAVRMTFNENPPPEWTLSYACTNLTSEKRLVLQKATVIVAPTFSCASGCLLVSNLAPPRLL
jgi:hypothetical protein